MSQILPISGGVPLSPLAEVRPAAGIFAPGLTADIADGAITIETTTPTGEYGFCGADSGNLFRMDIRNQFNAGQKATASKDGAALKCTSSVSNTARSYFFRSFPKSLIVGKNVKATVRWAITGILNPNLVSFFIKDGAYDRTSDLDFPLGIVSKGAGTLVILSSIADAAGTISYDATPDLAASTEADVTFFFYLIDGSSQSYGVEMWVDELVIG